MNQIHMLDHTPTPIQTPSFLLLLTIVDDDLIKPILDGGFLQFGSPNLFSCARLLGETDFNCIIVTPAYRLGLLGFLASEELHQDAIAVGEESCGNFGFWDQRQALEWTRENIHLFNGNPLNITVSGYSAGSILFYSLSFLISM